MKRILLLISLAVCLAGCQKHEEQPPQTIQALPTKTAHAPAAVKQLLSEPIEATRVELPSEAPPYWRGAAGDSRPALILLSMHPFLLPLAEEQRAEVTQLIASAPADDFIKRGSYYRTDPALLSTQAVSAALEAGLFSELVWVFPSTTPPEQMVLDTFRQQMVETGFLTEAESAGLQLDGGSFFGIMRGIPFRATPSTALPQLEKPAVLHLDLSYFKGLYKSEIKTPLYPLLLQVAKQIQSLKLMVHGVTLSFSTLERQMALETRFLVNRFAEILADPTLLDKKLPLNWSLHSEALYTINFFMESKVTELYQQAIKEAPLDPAILYGMALRQQRNKDLAASLKLIDLAALQDPGYALEYVVLAERAAEAKDFNNATMLLEKTQPYFPFDPFITLQLAGYHLEAQRFAEARDQLAALKNLNWSQKVHGNMPKVIDEMLAESEKPHPQDKEHP